MNIKQQIKNIINYTSNKWQLNNLRSMAQSPFSNNYVALAYSEKYKADVVLKILLDNTQEPEMLALFNGNGCVKLLDYDIETKSLLLKYIIPGTTLKTLFPKDDNAAIEITCQLIKEMHVKNLLTKATNIKTINQLLSLLLNFNSKIVPTNLLKKAQQLSEILLSSQQKFYLLHGDLHHDNILQNNSSWITIDPQGVIGPLEYELGRFIMNPVPNLLQQPDAKAIIKNRIDKFSEFFDFDKQQLTDWVFVHSMLSACWAEKDDNKYLLNYLLEFIKIIEKL